MSDNSPKPSKPKKSAKSQPSVLGSLSTTRPERIGGRPRTRAATPSAAAAAKTATAAKPGARKPRASAAKRATEKPRASAAKAAPPPPAEEPRRDGPPTGPELVTTALQAVGELAQIGITVGGQVLRRAARRVPRP